MIKKTFVMIKMIGRFPSVLFSIVALVIILGIITAKIVLNRYGMSLLPNSVVEALVWSFVPIVTHCILYFLSSIADSYSPFDKYSYDRLMVNMITNVLFFLSGLLVWIFVVIILLWSLLPLAAVIAISAAVIMHPIIIGLLSQHAETIKKRREQYRFSSS